MHKTNAQRLLLYLLVFILSSVVTIAAPPPSYSPSLHFTKCPNTTATGLSCARFPVPIDWANPGGPTIELFIAKIAAKDQKNKIGSLIYNPGGPGVSASGLLIELAEAGVSVFGESIQDKFDILGPDPRTVGQSHPLKCDYKLFNERVNYQPTTDAEFATLVKANKALGDSCRNLTGPVFDYADSRSVARDFEAIRAALGEAKLNYLGISYGTMIGQAYAALFPQRIRVMALDGSLDHSLSPASLISSEVASYENEFLRFADWCAATTSCPLHGRDVRALFKTLVARANRSPLPAPGCVSSGACRPAVTGEDIRFNLQPQLVLKRPILIVPGWAQAAQALKEADAGNATALSSAIAQSDSDATISASGVQVLCLDWNHTDTTLAGLKYKEMLGRDLAPYTGGAGGFTFIEARCIAWPRAVQYLPKLVDVTETPPLLITGCLHDPETPYVWGQGLRDQLKTSVFATRRGDGHTSYFLGGDTAKAIDRYLVTGETPPPNTVYDS